VTFLTLIGRFFGGRRIARRAFVPRPPTRCALWRRNDLQDRDLLDAFAAVETLSDDGSHNSATLVGCRECGQLYLSVFEEHIRFGGEDDEIYRLYLPVRRGDDVAALAARGLLKLSGYRPHLRADPGHVRWVR
jgi:hypothetical protein